MKVLSLFFILSIHLSVVFAADGGEILKFKSKIGFKNGEDKILAFQFIEGSKEFLIIGEKSVQIWNVEDATLKNSVPHNLSQFAPRGFFSKYILLNLPQTLDLMSPYLVDPEGKWIALIEKTDDKNKSLIVRSLKDLKQIAVLKLPNVSTEFVYFDKEKSEINSFGRTSAMGDFAVWDRETFDLKRVISIADHKWHKLLKSEDKMIVGAGDTDRKWNMWDPKHGSSLTLRDVKTGAIEKEFSADNLEPRTSFQKTVISPDENYLMSERNNRFFVWEIAGDGKPRFEVSRKSDKDDFGFVNTIGGRFIAFSLNKSLQIYDFAGNGEPKFTLAAEKPNDSVNLIDQTEDANYMVVGEDGKLSVIATAGNGSPVYQIARNSSNERFTTVRFIDGEKFLAVGRVNRSDKIPERTEFYNIETGKIAFTVPFGFDENVRFTTDKKLIYSDGLGSRKIWNFAANKGFFIGLETYYPESNDALDAFNQYPYNLENVEFSPDFRFSLKSGDDIVSVFDNENGLQVSQLFDAERVKYDKKKQIKKSGLGEAGWSPDGKIVYAIDDKSRTVNFWKMSE